jgi:hypothetical protein
MKCRFVFSVESLEPSAGGEKLAEIVSKRRIVLDFGDGGIGNVERVEQIVEGAMVLVRKTVAREILATAPKGEM